MPAVREAWADGPGLIASMSRHWLVILVTAGLLGVAAYNAEAGKDAVFETAAQLEFGDVQRRTLDPGEPAPANPARQLSNRTGHMRSHAVLERASEQLDGAVEPGTIGAAIEILADPDRVDAVTILARSGDPEEAAAVANAVAEAYQDVAAERERERMEEATAELDGTISRLQARLSQLDDQPAGAPAASVSMQRRVAAGQLVELQTRRERLAAAASLADAGVTAYDPAPPGWQVAPSPRRMGGLGAFVGLALASAYAYWREGRAGPARSAEQVKTVLKAPLLAHLPTPRDRRWRHARVWRDLLEHQRDAYQFLGLALDRTLTWLPGAHILVVGVRQRPANAAVALNTAVALRHENRRVLLVDADLRDRRLTSLWGLEDALGLADLTDIRVAVNQTTMVTGTGRDTSWSFMPSGTPPLDPFTCLRGLAVPRLLEELEADRASNQALRVVLHAPALLDSADAGAVAGLVDGVVLVVCKGANLDEVAQAAEAIELAGGRLLGFVFLGGRPSTKRQRDFANPRGHRRHARPRYPREVAAHRQTVNEGT